MDLQALGDFDPSSDTYESLGADTRGQGLVIPATTRALLVRARTSFGTWTGVEPVGETGTVDVGLFRDAGSCALGLAGAYPDGATAAVLGYAASTRTLLVSGGDGSAAAAALTVDLRTGVAASVPFEDGPLTARAFGTVTPFGPDLLVAGGVDPETGAAVDRADVFRAGARRFDARVELSRARARHAAVALESGETLLVGGRDASGRALRALEAVSPETLEYRISGLTRLEAARLDPTALRLTDGRVLVAGGVADDGAPVPLLEWLDATAEAVVATSSALAPAFGRAFVAMPGGGALAVGGCGSVDDAGCLTPLRDVAWILPDGEVRVLDALDVDAPTPRLVEGSEGRPWLVAGPSGARVLRVFDPFLARFTAPSAALTPPASLDAQLVALDAGAFAWLSPGEPGDAVVAAVRHGVRGPYTATTAPLVLADVEGIAPDRPAPFAGVGTLLTLGDPDLRVVLADTDYEDVSVEIDVSAPDDGGPAAPPTVYLGGRAYGEGDCPWPGSSSAGSARLVRVRGEVRLERDGQSRACAGSNGRVRVTLGAAAPVSVRGITVRRTVD